MGICHQKKGAKLCQAQVFLLPLQSVFQISLLLHLCLMKNPLIALVEKEYSEALKEKNFPEFRAGDTINVHVKIKEGDKERVQQFQGVVIQRRHTNSNGETFTVRKVSNGVGVERVFPINSPNVDKIELVRRGKVRRARLFYLRGLMGKAARIKERR